MEVVDDLVGKVMHVDDDTLICEHTRPKLSSIRPNTVMQGFQAAKELEKMDISACVIDPVTVKPLDVDLIRDRAQRTRAVVICENHNVIGGLTSAVQDALFGKHLNVGRVAVEDQFGEVGPQDYLRERYDLTSDHIVREARRALKR